MGSHIVNKTANFLELDKINKFKVILDIHHIITAKFILRCYHLKKKKVYTGYNVLRAHLVCVHSLCILFCSC